MHVIAVFAAYLPRKRERFVIRPVQPIRAMPPRTKRRRQSLEALAIAREKLVCVSRDVEAGPSTSVSTSSLATSDEDYTVLLSPTPLPDEDDEETDPPFDLDDSMRSDTDHQLETFCENWVLQLDRDDRLSLGIFLAFQLRKQLDKGETEAAELAGLMIGKSDRTVRQWIKDFVENDYQVPDSQQGHYQRTGVLWHDEELNKKATEYVRSHNVVKG